MTVTRKTFLALRPRVPTRQRKLPKKSIEGNDKSVAKSGQMGAASNGAGDDAGDETERAKAEFSIARKRGRGIQVYKQARSTYSE